MTKVDSVQIPLLCTPPTSLSRSWSPARSSASLRMRIISSASRFNLSSWAIRASSAARSIAGSVSNTVMMPGDRWERCRDNRMHGKHRSNMKAFFLTKWRNLSFSKNVMNAPACHKSHNFWTKHVTANFSLHAQLGISQSILEDSSNFSPEVYELHSCELWIDGHTGALTDR